MIKSTSLISFPTFDKAFLTACGNASIAKSHTALPSIWKYCFPSSKSSELNGVRTPPAGISITEDPDPSDINQEPKIPLSFSTSESTTAPAPSPNNTHVALSFQFNILEYISDPTTSTF